MRVILLARGYSLIYYVTMKHKHNHSNAGFTIVELLIVIVVIAILATISIVAYRGIRERAILSTVKSDFANAAKKAELYKINAANDTYPTSLANLIDADLKFSKSSYDAVLWCANASAATAWAVVANAKDGKSYIYSSVTRAFAEFTSNKVFSVSGGTTCPAAGMGGVWTWILGPTAGNWSI